MISQTDKWVIFQLFSRLSDEEITEQYAQEKLEEYMHIQELDNNMVKKESKQIIEDN